MWCLSTGGADVGLESTLQCFDGNDALWKVSNGSYHIIDSIHVANISSVHVHGASHIANHFRGCQQWWSDALHNMNHAVVARRSSEVSGKLISATT